MCTTQYYKTFWYFDIYGAQYHDTILDQYIDILPYRYVLQITRLVTHVNKRENPILKFFVEISSYENFRLVVTLTTHSMYAHL